MCVFRDLWLQMFVKPSSRENCSAFWTICFRSEKTNTQGDMQQMKNHTRATLSCFLSDKVSSLSCCCARVCVFETWWIHTAIHPARQCFHYFTTSLIPSSWSFSVRMDGKHPVKLPHTFTSTQLIVTAHHTNAQREKEDEIKTANFGKEIRVRKKGRMEMAKEKREKKNTVIESNCVPGSFSGYIRMCSRVRGLATFHAAAENDILSADRQHSITYTQTKTFFQHVLLLSNWRDEEWALTVCSREARHKLSFILV